MPIIQPPKPRHTLEDLGDTLKFMIPNPKHWFVVLWLGVLMTSYILLAAVFLWETIASLSRGEPITIPESGGAVFGGLCAGVVVSLFIGLPLYGMLWQLTGKETITATGQSIKLRRSVAGLGRTNEYLLSDVKNLRSEPVRTPSRLKKLVSRPLLEVFGYMEGRGAFDYRSETIRIAGFVDEAEVAQIIGAIQQRFPHYRIKEHDAQSFPANAPSPRLTIEHADEVLRITIPSRRRLRSLLLPAYFLVGWGTVGVIFAYIFFSSLVPSKNVSPETAPGGGVSVFLFGIGALFVVFIVIAFLFNWLAMLYQFLWPLIGYETIEIAKDSLVIHYRVSIHKWQNEFLREHVKAFRVSWVAGDFSFPAPMGIRSNGLVTFDYGAKTYYCGNDADDSEARQIVALIHQRFPQYR